MDISTKSNQNGTKFRVHRLLILIFSLLLYTMVFFHRNCPLSMTNDLIDYFKVSKSDLSLISSMFMWSSAAAQFLVAPFTDVYEPFYALVIFNAISILGCVLCGFSTKFIVFVIGRFLTGVGIGPTFLAISKFALGWYNGYKYLPIITGISLGFGGLGTFLSSVPLVQLEKSIGWRWVFFTVGIFSAIMTIILGFIGRADPELFGYDEVEGSKISKPYKAHMKRKMKSKLKKKLKNDDSNSQQLNEKLNQDSHHGINEQNDDIEADSSSFCLIAKTMWNNLLSVIKLSQFWINSILNFVQAGLSMAFQAYWAGLWMTDVKHYSTDKMSSISIAFTIGQIVPPVIVPFISSKIGHKNMVHVQTFLYGVMCVIFAIFHDKLGDVVIAILLFINTATMFIILPSLSALIVGIVSPDASATGMGVLNVFAFVGASVLQMISATILKHEKQTAENVYSWKSYNNAIFYPSIALIGAVVLLYFAATDPFKNKSIDNTENHSKETKESITDQTQSNPEFTEEMKATDL